MSENAQDLQQGGEGKEAAKFEKNFSKLVALFKGKKVFKGSKVGEEDLDSVLDELVKEEKQQVITEFKEGAKKIIKSNRDFNKFVKDQQAAMDKAINEKRKELNKEMEALFGKVEKIENIERDYYEQLRQAATQGTSLPGSDTQNGGAIVNQ